MRQQRSVIYFLILLPCICFSQVAKDDFMRINNTYQSSEEVSFKASYQAFSNHTVQTPLSTESGEVKKKGDASYSRIGSIETIVNEHYRVIVDHEDKNISVLGIKKQEGKQEKDTYPVDLEKLLALCTKVEFSKTGTEQGCYTIEIPEMEYKQIKLFYNTTSFFIEKIILYYSEKQNLVDGEGPQDTPRLEISYSDYTTHPDEKQLVFTYDPYLEKQNGKLVAKPAYKSYTVHEQLFN